MNSASDILGMVATEAVESIASCPVNVPSPEAIKAVFENGTISLKYVGGIGILTRDFDVIARIPMSPRKAFLINRKLENSRFRKFPLLRHQFDLGVFKSSIPSFYDFLNKTTLYAEHER